MNECALQAQTQVTYIPLFLSLAEGMSNSYNSWLIAVQKAYDLLGGF